MSTTAHPSAPLTGPDAPSALDVFLDRHLGKVIAAGVVLLLLIAGGVA